MKLSRFKIIFSLCCSILVRATLSFAQSSQIDSLLKVLPTQSDDDTNKAITLFKLCGKIYTTDTKRAIHYGEEALAISQRLNFKRGIASSENNLGIICESSGDYQKAADYFLKSIEIKEELGNRSGLETTYSNLGEVFDLQGNFEKASLYYSKSLDIANKLHDTIGISESYLNMGVMAVEKNDNAKALTCYRTALSLSSVMGDSLNMASELSNIGVLYETTHQYDSALYYYGLGAIIRERIGDNLGLLTSYNNQGSVNIELGNFKEAERWYFKSIETQKIVNSLPSLETSYGGLSEVYDSLQDYKSAKRYFEKYKATHDSIYSLQSLKEVNQLELKYEQDKKDKEDKILAAAAKREQNLIFIFLTTIILLVSTFSIFLFNRFRLIRKQKTIIETKTKEIVDSINYALHLQQAILPPQKLVKSLFPESFIFYRPKDIVAGDFYWIEKVDGKIFFAVADCTGHGVPGAMVSIVCSNALSRVVKEFGIKDPGKILDKVRELVIQTFEKSESEVKDGMDISLCCIESEKMSLTFAGANNSLWLVRNHELIVYEADHQPIGIFEMAKPFINHSVQLQKGDCVFLGTDGYSDQFGGAKGKKFKTANLKNLLMSNASRPCDEQLQVLELTFDKWKGNYEQVDDVCVACIKM